MDCESVDIRLIVAVAYLIFSIIGRILKALKRLKAKQEIEAEQRARGQREAASEASAPSQSAEASEQRPQGESEGLPEPLRRYFEALGVVIEDGKADPSAPSSSPTPVAQSRDAYEDDDELYDEVYDAYESSYEDDVEAEVAVAESAAVNEWSARESEQQSYDERWDDEAWQRGRERVEQWYDDTDGEPPMLDDEWQAATNLVPSTRASSTASPSASNLMTLARRSRRTDASSPLSRTTPREKAALVRDAIVLGELLRRRGHSRF